MIEMFINAQPLRLPDDLSIRVELNFPAFENDSIPASVVYQFDLPEKANEQTFRYANHVEILGKFKEYDWRMNYGGIPLFTGKLVILSVSGGRFRCAATLRQLSTGFSDKNLTDFHFETEYLVPPGSGVTEAYRIPTIDYELFSLPQMYLPNLYSSNPAWSGFVNRFPFTDSHSYSEAAIPCFRVFKIIEKVFNTENFGVDYDSSMTALVLNLFRSLLFFNNYTLDTVPNESESGEVSTWPASYYENRIYPENHLPEVSVNTLLVALKQMYGCQTFIDNRSQMVQFLLLDDILKSLWLDLSKCALTAPEITINEPKAYLLKYNIDEYKTGISGISEYITLSAAPRPWHVDQLISVRAVNSYYKSERFEDVNDAGQTTSSIEWSRVGDNYRSVRTNPDLNTCEEVKVDACPVSMIDLGGTFYPYFTEAGVSARFNPDASKVDKLIFFHRTGNNGTRGTSSDIAADGSTEQFIPSLKLDENSGLYAKVLKPWYEFIENANEYSFDLKVTLEDMLNIIPIFGYQDVHVQSQMRRIRIKNQVYVPKQFTFELTHTQIKCQAKLLKDDRNK